MDTRKIDVLLQRTAELEKELAAKNRELAIEAALDRVRTRAMAMQHSDELKDLIATVSIELAQLDFVLNRSTIIIFDPLTKGMTWWMSHPETPTEPMGLFVQYHEQPPLLAYVKAWENRELRYQYVLEGDEKSIWDTFLFAETELSQLPAFVIANMRAQTKVYLSASFNRFGALSIATLDPLSHTQFDVLLRFARVFDQTYTRFNDLKQAEAQALEARIEAAMEKIRGRALAMSRSDELKDVALVLFEKLDELKVAHNTVAIQLFDFETKDSVFWPGNLLQDEPPKVWLPYDEKMMKEDTCHKDLWDAMSKGEIIFNKVYTKDQKDRWFDYVFANNDTDVIQPHAREFIRNAETHTVCFIPKKNFALFSDSWDGSSYTEAEFNVLKRAAKVFEQAYTRFLDLQKAEAQAKEAQIQLALERVRARAMAMHSSNELKEVVQVLFEKLRQIDLVFEDGAVSILVFQEGSKDYVHWTADPSQAFATAFEVPYTEHSIPANLMQARESGVDFFSKIFPVEEKNDYFRYLFEHTNYRYLPDVLKELILGSQHYGYSVAFAEKSAILIPTNSGRLVPEDKKDILKRFASVFDQAFIRFLDLEKAEAQAREAQLEAVLEKIRSRSLAMHHSNELESVIAIMFEKLNELNVPLGSVAIWLFDKVTMDSIFWVGNNWQQPAMVRLPYDEQLMKEDTNYKDSWQAWLTGESYLNREYNAEQKDKFFRYVFKHNDLVAIPPAAREMLMQGQKYTACLLVEKNSALYFDSWQEAIYDKGRIRVLKSVAKVFEQAYVRFLDLQKAEAYAREAQIEAALEKVRSASLAMHRSEELKDVITVVFEKLKDLGLVFQNAGIQLFTEGSNDIVQWVASTNLLSAPALVNLPFNEKDYKESEIIRDIWKAKEKGESVYDKHYSFDEKNKFFEYAARCNNLDQLPEKAREAQMQAPDYTQTLVAEKHSALWVDSYSGQTISEEGFDVLGRTAKVFEQAYTRFLDLQKAEAYAREAQIEAAMERLRGRAMAMQGSSELAAVIQTMYTELKKLDESLNRCFIMIFDEQTGGVVWWMAGDDEASTERAYHIPYSNHPPQLAYLKGWREREERWLYTIEGKEKKEWDAFLFNETELSNLPRIVIQNMKSFENIYLSASFNGFGCLTTGSVEPLSRESFDILVRFSKVFDLSYTRFNDLKQAEAQAVRAEQDLIEIKAARKKAEDALAALKATQAQLIQQEKMASLGELTAGIAHEIQNPLNFVNNFADISKELMEELKQAVDSGNTSEIKALADDMLSNLDKVVHHGQRADSIVKGMLQHSKSATGEKEPTDVNDLVAQYLQLAYHGYRVRDKSFNTDVSTSYEPSLEKLNLVPQEIGRVLLNLFNNAFYAVSEKKKQQNGTYKPFVQVSTKREGHNVQITVHDNGTGIPQKVADKIFQPFFTTKPTGEGTGLGLSLSYDVITKGHGGSLTVHSTEGEGSEFVVTLRADKR